MEQTSLKKGSTKHKSKPSIPSIVHQIEEYENSIGETSSVPIPMLLPQLGTSSKQQPNSFSKSGKVVVSQEKISTTRPSIHPSTSNNSSSTPPCPSNSSKKTQDLLDGKDILDGEKKNLAALQDVAVSITKLLVMHDFVLSSKQFYFPLHVYDSSEWETKTPEEWLKHGPCRGTALSLNEKTKDPGVWSNCMITGYDALEDAYHITWTAGPRTGPALVHRVHLCFAEEDRLRFVKRFMDAWDRRKNAEARIKINYYIECMPNDINCQLTVAQTNNILSLALGESRPTPSVYGEQLLEEVNTEFIKMQNKLIFEANLENLKIEFPEIEFPKENLSSIEFPQYLGVVAIPPYPYKERLAQCTLDSYLTSSAAIRALLQVSSGCDSILEFKLLNTSQQVEIGRVRSMNLEEFTSLQCSTNQVAMRNLRDGWITYTGKLIRESLSKDDRYNLDVSNLVEYEGSSLEKLLRRMHYMMDDRLRDITMHSMTLFTEFIEKLASKKVTIMSTKEVHLVEGEHSLLGVPPLFKLNLIVTPENGFSYNEDPQSFVDAVLEQFDTNFQRIKGLECIERVVLERLFWPQQDKSVSVDINETWAISLRERILQATQATLLPLNAYKSFFTSYLDFIHLDADQYIASIVVKPNQDEEPDECESVKIVTMSSDELRSTLRKHKMLDLEVRKNLPEMPLDLGMFSIEISMIRDLLISKHQQIIQKLLQFHSEHCNNVASGLSNKFEEIYKNIGLIPKDIEQLTDLQQYIDGVSQQIQSLQDEIQGLLKENQLLDEFYYQVTDEHSKRMWNLVAWPSRISAYIAKVKWSMEERKLKYAKQMELEQIRFEKTIVALQEEVNSFSKYESLLQVEEIASHALAVQKKIEQAQADANLLNSRELLFGKDCTEYESLNQLKKAFEPYNLLWSTAYHWGLSIRNWRNSCFLELNAEQVEKEVEEYGVAIQKAYNFFKTTRLEACTNIASSIKEQNDAFKPFVPLLVALRNPGMRSRHWEELSSQLGFALEPDETFTLDNIMELKLLDSIEPILKVAEAAAKEYQIEECLTSMLNQWENIQLQIIPYKETGTFVLKGVDDIQATLDEHTTMTKAMQYSSFKGPFEQKINEWSEKLQLVSEVMEEWIAVQRSWLYLQPIFESPDINKQLPTEGKRFASVDKNWRQTLSMAKSKSKCIEFCSNEKLLEKFKESNNYLDLVQKGLSDYLEVKRSVFPRFYFLSNDELLSILSESKDATLVQPHLKKCFEGITKVKFEDDLRISAMQSSEGETVHFLRPIHPQGISVEFWMLELEKMMKTSIRDIMDKSIVDYTLIHRTEWIQKWPGMCVLNASQLHWTREMEEAMDKDGAQGIQKMLTRQVAQLADMVTLVRGELQPMTRITMGALTVIDVHARDVTAKLAHMQVESKADFLWSSQLKYYWEEDLFAQMVTSRRMYGYEYLGNSFRLVITPLTDKCYLTLMGALQMILGGAPAGPAGTGKTETTKDLAKALAKQCVVFNCSDGLDYIAMGKFFKGLASCGAWACFDEFNRIDIEVLSVVGQQIITLQLGIRRGDQRIIFEESDILLDPSFGVFITMNPGYAGRSELPDSLAALFRPVAMMVPDYALIGEIMFFAYGFENAKMLGAKMVTTFKLCSEQLSSQYHYDYGMRAVKTVITAAGNLKRLNPKLDEEVLLLRALQDVNLPKFLACDLPLFNGIVSDLFPGKNRSEENNMGILLNSIRLKTIENHLQPIPFFLTKVVQLYETIVVRHGLMVVGPTGGGKSSSIKVLSSALNELKFSGEKGFAFEKVNQYQLNPKAITMGQLYGEYDCNTHEWQDGILSTIYREAAHETTTDRQWIIFDGPVDAIWIENMNTVLDDNKKLCLNSGEMLQMSEQMTMMFEVEDLSVASPATVSRTGMIYMEPSALGTDPLVQSWLEASPNCAYKAKLLDLLDDYLEKVLIFHRSHLTELVPTMNNNLVCSLFRILDCFLRNQQDDRIQDKDIEPLFMYSLIWSIGITVNDKGRILFDQYIRGEMTSSRLQGCPIPQDGLVYDYSYNLDLHAWMKWKDTIAPISIPPGTEYAEIVVPTIDSVRNTYLLNLLTKGNKHIMMVGVTGTGKTVNITRYLSCLQDTYIPVPITFTAQTSANQTQDLLDSRMEKRRKGVYGPPVGKRFLVYVDDVNMPKREIYFAQPPIELLRQWLDQSGWYDRKSLSFKSIVDLQLITSMGPPGGGRNPLTGRFVRHFNVIGYSETSDESKTMIFSMILNNFLIRFSPEVQQLASKLVYASIEVYNTICKELLPTPAKSHYTFNLRDLSKVFQGCLMGDEKKVVNSNGFLRLWIHESKRVYEDRMVNKEDRFWFTSLLKQQIKSIFELDYDAIVNSSILLYGDYMQPRGGEGRKIYEEITDFTELSIKVEDYLSDYNAESKTPMSLVLFMDALEHVSRISRIIRQPLGNALLLGVGGSGRQSLTRLATYMQSYSIFQVEIIKGYGMHEWHDDIKNCLLQAGLLDKPVVFLFTDVQITDETMLEDINGLLNSGDIPNLYSPEDLDKILNTCRGDCVKKKLAPSKSNIFSQFLMRVRRNLHLVLCMSPIGEAFRERLRMFPALVNCCTIDWFSEWPAEALASVASSVLHDSNLNNDAQLSSLVQVFQMIHQSVETESKVFFDVLRRSYYVTPTSYLDLLSTFKAVLLSQRQQVYSMKSRLQNGVNKIATTKSLVSTMQQELVELQPILTTTQQQVEEMMIQITKDRLEADETKSIVEKEEEVASNKASRTKEIADDAQRDLDEALPALESALACLNKLKKADIDEVKALKTPPAGVKLTMEVVCILFGHKPVYKTDPDKPGKKIADYWEIAQKTVLSNANKFMESLLTFDKDNIPEQVISKVSPYIEDPNFTPEIIEKCSKACTAICLWSRAMHTYHFVAKAVVPKKIALAEAQEELDRTLNQLAIAQDRMKEVSHRLKELEMSYNEAIAKKEELAEKVITCQMQLSNAEKLIGGLGGEEVRWNATVNQLSKDYDNLLGDVLVSSGTISYLGAFTQEFRDKLIDRWRGSLTALSIPHTENCDIVSTLIDPVQLRQWEIAGLPTDTISTQNGLIMSRSKRWSLSIDPQGQANRFLKKLGKSKENAENGLDVIKQTDKNFLRTLQNAIRYGKWILLEDVKEELDPSLEPILLQQKFKQGGVEVIKFGDICVPYNDKFRLFITTNLANPHYAPEICVKVTLLNFTITMSGLEQQLLGVVTQKEMPDLAEKKNELVISNAESKKQLYDIESQILHILSNSEGNLLDDTQLIDTLADAKATSQVVGVKMREAEETEKEIDSRSEEYRSVAYRAALLFFCIADLAWVDPMYQYSLSWFTNLFIRGLASAETSSTLSKRLLNLNNYFTFSVYKNVCRSLFERHKVLFSFLLAIKILQGNNDIDPLEWHFLISGLAEDPVKMENPAPEWIESRMFHEICSLSSLPQFKGFATDFVSNLQVYRNIFDSSDPQNQPLSAQFDNVLNSFQKMCILRCIRPDKITASIQKFVCEKLGEEFVEPPPFDLPGIYLDSTPATPLLFILSQGSDPAKDLLVFTKKMSMENKLKSIALGQGQGKIAARMIENATVKGEWVLLQNCHLCLSWMKELDRICSGLDVEKIHPDFRLWLTSMPTKSFPTSILQNGVKMTLEAPKGLRANLRNSYLKFTEEKLLYTTTKAFVYRKLLFGLCFYHAIVCERKKFGALGWNISYQFNDTDLDISIAQLELFIDTYDEVPFDVLCMMTSAVNYGGRITDDKDMRTSEVILSAFFHPDILLENYSFSKSGKYYSITNDQDRPLKSYIDYINSLPIHPEPEIFGMHENANITCDQRETYETFDIIQSLQPQTCTGGVKSREEMIADTATLIKDKLPVLFDIEEASRRYPISYEESMNTVLIQEAQRFNGLLRVMKESLVMLEKGLKGLVVMSSELDAIGNSLYEQKVPLSWESKAYPSLKPLSAWFNDLLDRLHFIEVWFREGVPKVFWISGFYFPQGFLTGIIQNHARRHKVPIDRLSFDFRIQEDDIAMISSKPLTGCYIYGLFIEGARWNKEIRSLDDPLPKELYAKMPVIQFLPVENRIPPKKGIYRCPVYKTLTRTGTLSTTGHSTNFIAWIELPSGKNDILRRSLVSETNAQILFSDQLYWIKAGVACFCSLRY